MGKLILFGKLLLAVIIISILFTVVKYANTIRLAVSQHPVKSVAGVQTNFEKEVKQNINDYANNAKDQVMNIKISDIVNGFSGVGKINQDIHSAAGVITEQMTRLLKKYGRSTNTNK
jgi:hypothetical protein